MCFNACKWYLYFVETVEMSLLLCEKLPWKLSELLTSSLASSQVIIWWSSCGVGPIHSDIGTQWHQWESIICSWQRRCCSAPRKIINVMLECCARRRNKGTFWLVEFFKGKVNKDELQKKKSWVWIKNKLIGRKQSHKEAPTSSQRRQSSICKVSSQITQGRLCLCKTNQLCKKK